MELKEIAKKIKEANERIILIYAFNGIGKTQLSVEYKDITKIEESHTGVYYNAYSEDLFQWDNDPENKKTGIRLNIVHSSLNKQHSYIIEDPQKLKENLDRYFVRYYFKLNYDKNDYSEKGIESISFYSDKEMQHEIKISRGEERIFVWCFFLTLFDVSSLADEQDAHFFIDDPVSSLDEHNIHITASTIMDVIRDNFDKKKLIITTHHVGLFSILIDRLRKASGSEKFKNLTKTYILGIDSKGETILSEYNHDVFLYHLHLYKMISDNIAQSNNGVLDSYNFVLLRQLLENIASFLGKSGSFSFALSRIGMDNANEVAEVINEQSHKDVYYYQTGLMSPEQMRLFIDVFDKITNTYRFHI